MYIIHIFDTLKLKIYRFINIILNFLKVFKQLSKPIIQGEYKL